MNNIWTPVSKSLPPVGTFVLAVRKSGYHNPEFEILTAQCDPDYKGWVDPGNTRLTDSGEDPVAWAPMLAYSQPRALTKEELVEEIKKYKRIIACTPDRAVHANKLEELITLAEIK
jgi:hypothetical protein